MSFYENSVWAIVVTLKMHYPGIKPCQPEALTLDPLTPENILFRCQEVLSWDTENNLSAIGAGSELKRLFARMEEVGFWDREFSQALLVRDQEQGFNVVHRHHRRRSIAL